MTSPSAGTDVSTWESTPPPSETRRLPRHWTAELLRRMAVIYGERLAAVLTDPTAAEEWIDTWSEQLGWLTGDQLGRGLMLLEAQVRQAAREGRTSWPLTAVEFAGLCQSPAASRPPPGGPLLPRVRTATQRECMAHIRQILGIGE